MEVGKITIKDLNGLHLRRAAELVKFTRLYKSKITFCHNCKLADSCSILDVLALGATKGCQIAVIAEGPDEKEAVRDISGRFSDGGGI
jgi:phosphocarrier protein